MSQATVDTTIASGQILMQNKRLLCIDGEIVAKEAQNLAQRPMETVLEGFIWALSTPSENQLPPQLHGLSGEGFIFQAY